MVLEKIDALMRIDVQRRPTSTLALPRRALPLIQEAMEGGCEFPRGTLVVEVVGFSAPRQGDVAAMMKVVVPDRIEAVPTFGGPTDEFGILRLAATMTISRSRAAARAHRVSSCDDVLVGIVENLLRGVEAQPVEVEFADPVASVLPDVLAHRSAIGPVEIQRPSPFDRIFVGRIAVRKQDAREGGSARTSTRRRSPSCAFRRRPRSASF
jgi:hypothetical protein